MADNFNAGEMPLGFTPYDALIGDGEPRILVALSGGADSRALFDLTARYCEQRDLFFFAAHVNHGIRGDEALRDRDFCIALANTCPQCKDIFVLDADVPALAESSGRSIELEARIVRYNFFEKVMRDNAIPYLATAHNADDNLETLIFNLTRGSGVKGMCGIPEVRELGYGKVVRPILKMTKKEILEYCRGRGLDFVTDSTNASTDYSRNMIRAEIIPLLERLNPDVRASATRLSGNMRSLCAFAEANAADFLHDESDHIALSALTAADNAIFPFVIQGLLARTCPDVTLEAVHITAVKELCLKGRDGSSVSIPGGFCARIRGSELVFEPDSREKRLPAPYEIKLAEGENQIPPGMRLTVLAGGSMEKKENADSVRISYLPPSLTARTRLPGDRILVGGMHKSVKKLMCDKKIPVDMRDILPIVCDGNEILWIPFVALRDGAACKKDGFSLSFEINAKF